MTHLATLETSAGVARVLGSPSATMREFDSNFIAHEVPFMIFGNACFCCFTGVEFLMKYWFTSLWMKRKLHTTKP
jgi:hypothetical protein